MGGCKIPGRMLKERGYSALDVWEEILYSRKREKLAGESVLILNNQSASATDTVTLDFQLIFKGHLLVA